jgi:outer membrane immunogenic protein
MLFRKLIRAGAAVLAALSVVPANRAIADGICRDAPVYAPMVSAPALYVSPAIWQGFYAGANFGGNWSDVSDGGTHALFFEGQNPVFFRGGDLSGSGVLGGVQFGYNWQANCCFAFGIEVDIGGLDAGISNNVFVPVTGTSFANFDIRSHGGWYGDVTGRLGYTWGGALLYAKGGFAWLDPGLSVRQTVLVDGVPVFSNSGRDNGSGTLSGWTVGGGVEMKINPRWTWKIEYMFLDFSDIDDNCCFDGINNFKVFHNDLTVNTVKIGFNYSVNALPIPLK